MTPASDTPTPSASQRAAAPRVRRLAMIAILLGAAGLWASGRMRMLTATVYDDKSGESIHHLVGSAWEPAATPIALALLAALIVSLAVRPLLRRILGVIIAGLAATASFRAVTLLTAEADFARVRAILASGSATQKATAPEQISDWAQVIDVQVHTLPVVLALVASALAVAGGVLMVMRPGVESDTSSKYDTPEARRERASDDLDANPSSSRVMWDAMDAGVDPTDRER